MTTATLCQKWDNFKNIITPLDFIIMTNKNVDIFHDFPMTPYDYQLTENIYLNINILYIGILVSSNLINDLKKDVWFSWGVYINDNFAWKLESLQTIIDKHDCNIYLFKLKDNPIYHEEYQLKNKSEEIIDLSFNFVDEFDKIILDLSSNISEMETDQAIEKIQKMKTMMQEININIDETIRIAEEIANEINLIYIDYNYMITDKLNQPNYKHMREVLHKFYKIYQDKSYLYIKTRNLFTKSKIKKGWNRLKTSFAKKLKSKSKYALSFSKKFVYMVYIQMNIIDFPKTSMDTIQMIKYLVSKNKIANIFELIYDRAL